MPEDYQLFLTRGVVYTLWGDLRRAKEDYQKAVSLAPEQPGTQVALAICFMDQNQNAAAASVLRHAIHNGLADVRLYYYLVDVLFRQGLTVSSPEYREATEMVNASIRLEPRFAYSYLQRGRLQLMTSQVQNAIADFELARKLEPDSTDTAVSYQLAIAYRDLGRREDAERIFSEISENIKKQEASYRQNTLVNVMSTSAVAGFGR
jgi:tetratricopeptide (TPR) repeat protein